MSIAWIQEVSHDKNNSQADIILQMLSKLTINLAVIITFIYLFSHLADAFIQSDVQLRTL